MVACLRPGGLLVAEEPDCASAFHGSTDPVVGRVIVAAIELLQELAGGMNSAYGHELFHDVRSEGLVDLGSAGRTHMLRGADAGSGAAWLRYLRPIADRVADRGGKLTISATPRHRPVRAHGCGTMRR